MRKVFGNLLKRAHWTGRKMPRDVERFLTENNSCYVLITCGTPSKDGKMQVEMTYEGDACLAAYLIESAQGFIDDEPGACSPQGVHVH